MQRYLIFVLLIHVINQKKMIMRMQKKKKMH